jgi:hypothetical protein
LFTQAKYKEIKMKSVNNTYITDTNCNLKDTIENMIPAGYAPVMAKVIAGGIKSYIIFDRAIQLTIDKFPLFAESYIFDQLIADYKNDLVESLIVTGDDEHNNKDVIGRVLLCKRENYPYLHEDWESKSEFLEIEHDRMSDLRRDE